MSLQNANYYTKHQAHHMPAPDITDIKLNNFQLSQGKKLTIHFSCLYEKSLLLHTESFLKNLLVEKVILYGRKFLNQ